MQSGLNLGLTSDLTLGQIWANFGRKHLTLTLIQTDKCNPHHLTLSGPIKHAAVHPKFHQSLTDPENRGAGPSCVGRMVQLPSSPNKWSHRHGAAKKKTLAPPVFNLGPSTDISMSMLHFDILHFVFFWPPKRPINKWS